MLQVIIHFKSWWKKTWAMVLCRFCLLPYHLPQERQALKPQSRSPNWQRKALISKTLENRLLPTEAQKMLIKGIISRIFATFNFCDWSQNSSCLHTCRSGDCSWWWGQPCGNPSRWIYPKEQKKILLRLECKGGERLFNNCIIVSSSLKGTFLAWISSILPLRYLIIRVYAKKLMMQTGVLHMNLDLFPTVWCDQAWTQKVNDRK